MTTYESREWIDHHNRLRAIERAPLWERQDGRANWRAVMEETPHVVGERVRWLLDGCYGYGAQEAARSVARNQRMNRVACLSQMIAAIEWSCPAAFARQAWTGLTGPQKRAVDEAVAGAIRSWEADQG